MQEDRAEQEKTTTTGDANDEKPAGGDVNGVSNKVSTYLSHIENEVLQTEWGRPHWAGGLEDGGREKCNQCYVGMRLSWDGMAGGRDVLGLSKI